ncbi:MAG TPA: class I SAM-dependent methyltransferase family protein [Microlunatus sp.]
MDWYSWHDGYDGPLGARLQAVQDQISAALEETRGPIRVISICAGQGHDIVGSLRHFDRRNDVRALLVELDQRNAEAARRRIDDAGLSGLAVKTADAGVTDAYADLVPAHLILLCGVFGSLTDADIDRTVGLLPTLCDAGAAVVWTAHRAAPGLWDTALAAFGRHGFRELRTNGRSEPFGVGRHRMTAPPQPFEPGRRMFSFADEDTLIRTGRAAR